MTTGRRKQIGRGVERCPPSAVRGVARPRGNGTAQLHRERDEALAQQKATEEVLQAVAETGLEMWVGRIGGCR